jgi:adenylate kinase
MSKYIILLGAPGSGKGTQAKLLQTHLGLAHLSSGDLFRENISKQTPLGNLAKQYMDKGELVPDDVTVRMVMDRIQRPDCERGVVFDGFPRTDAQAQALDRALAAAGRKIGAVVLLDVRDQALIERLTARRVCPKDGAVYNLLTNPPRVSGICDNDGIPLEQRNDDQPETVKHRLQVYQTQTRPLVEYYKRSGLLKSVGGERTIDIIQAELVAALEKL